MTVTISEAVHPARDRSKLSLRLAVQGRFDTAEIAVEIQEEMVGSYATTANRPKGL